MMPTLGAHLDGQCARLHASSFRCPPPVLQATSQCSIRPCVFGSRCGQKKRDTGSLLFALCPDLSAVGLHDRASDGEAEPGPSVIAGPRWVYPVEPLEHERDVF